jgi:hypothetical protein
MCRVCWYEIHAEPTRGATNPKCAFILGLNTDINKEGIQDDWTYQPPLKYRIEIIPCCLWQVLASWQIQLSFCTKKSASFRDVNIQQVGRQICIHSSQRYTPSRWVNTDPGIVRTVLDLFQLSSSIVTFPSQGRTIMVNRSMYVVRPRCRMKLNDIWMARCRAY